MRLDKLGSDPELGLLKNGQPFSVEKLIEGTKDEPQDIGEGCFVQKDRASLEYNTKPAGTLEEWMEQHAYVFDWIKDFSEENDLEVCNLCECEYPEKFWTEYFCILGCEGDYCVYEGYDPDKEVTDENIGRLGFAGHIHISLDVPLTDDVFYKVIKALDIYLTIPNLHRECENRRRELYGQAGTFRFDKVKFEYRTLSNWWIFEEEDRKYIWERVNWIIDNLDDLDLSYDDKEIQDIINNRDLNKAQKIVEHGMELQS